MSKFGFDLDMLGQESKIRGLYLSIACEAEFFMDRIISKCEEIDTSKRDVLILSLPYEMGAKLKRCRTSITKYNIYYYNFFQPVFDQFEKLVKYRNMLAHGHANFDKTKSDKSYIIFDWIEGKKSNRERKLLKID